MKYVSVKCAPSKWSASVRQQQRHKPWGKTRVRTESWEWGAQVVGKHVLQPALMVTAGKDGVLTPDMADGMERWVPNLTRGHIEQCGHWTQQEEPEKLNRF